MSERKINLYSFPDVCICCGEPVPEGRMVCSECEHANFYANAYKKTIENKAHKGALFKKRKEG